MLLGGGYKMTAILNFSDYKSYLTNYYNWACDKDEYDNRVNYINNLYSNEYFKNIIDNTTSFISVLLHKMANEQNIYKENIFYEIKLPISYDAKKYISNGCSGGWHADTLFCIDDNDEEPLISEYIIKKYFGDKFRIELSEKEFEYFNPDEQAGCEYSVPIFLISGPLNEFNGICVLHDLNYNNESIKKEKQRELILVLRKVKDKNQTIK